MKNKHFCPILFLFCIALLYSCTSAPKHLAKAIAKDKPYVAQQTRLLWPCIVTASDTINTVDTVYDLIEAKCPDVDYITPEGKTITLPGKTTFLPGKTIYIDRVIKERVEDSAQVYLLQNNLEVASAMHTADTAKLNKTIATQGKKIDRKNKTLKWLWILLAALSVPYIIKLVRIIKPF